MKASFIALALLAFVIMVFPGQAQSAPGAAGPKGPRSAPHRKDLLFEFYIKNGLDTYIEKGRHDPKWDRSAEEVLTLLASIKSDPANAATNTAAYLEKLEAAAQAGCDDPFLQFLAMEAGLHSSGTNVNEFLKASVRMAKQMGQTGYPGPLKFFAQIFPWEQWQRLSRKSMQQPAQRKEALECFNAAYQSALQVVEDGRAPIEVVYEICDEMMRTVEWDYNRLPQFHTATQELLQKNWPGSAQVWLIDGKFNIFHAWQARGEGTADTVTPAGWKAFTNRIAKAERSLWRAWNVNKKIEEIPLEMIIIAKAKGGPRDRLELWFQRAMTINSNSLKACELKLDYLSPMWNGSKEELLEFGRECATSTQWGGKVPFAMVTAHNHLAGLLSAGSRTAYWLQPQVWDDLKTACERCLRTHPEGPNSARHAYIYNANRCEKWDVVLAQASLLTSTNVDYFGGQKVFDAMIERAKNHAPHNQN